MKRMAFCALAGTLLCVLAILFGTPAVNAQAGPMGSTVPPPSPDENGWLLRNAVEVGAGESHFCALMADARVKCWGRFFYLGIGAEGFLSSLPLDAYIPPEGAKDLSVNDNHTCIVSTDGGAYCWGENGGGQLGDGTTDPALRPVRVSGLASGVASIAAGVEHTCAVMTAGTVMCWGRNDEGQLGDGTTTNRLTPVDVVGLADVVALAAGWTHTCALRTDGSYVCWGNNEQGQLGDGTTADRLTPVTSSGFTNALVSITLGGRFTCALDSNDKAWCWGANHTGTLGDGTGQNSAVPVGVVGLDSGTLDIDAGYSHVCAITAAHGAQCWGSNDGGATGIETPGPYPPLSQCSDGGLVPAEIEGGYPAWYFCKPHDVKDLTSGAARITAGYFVSCALMEDSTVKCWGIRASGTIGNSWFPSYIRGSEVVGYLTMVNR